MSTLDAINLIVDERERQKAEEGWTEEHDDEHTDGSLALAAAAYAYAGSSTNDFNLSVWRIIWPKSWDTKCWKPKDRERDLVRAGALIVAELERLRRQRDRDEAVAERRADGR